MMRRHHYLLTFLPHLGELGDAPPLTLADLLAHVAESDGPRAAVEALLLADDLVQRDSLLAGESDQAAPTVLTDEQVRGDEPLPSALTEDESPTPPRVAADAVWTAYFRHAAQVAAQQGSGLLAAWVGMEVALRNALAETRAKALGLEAREYLVAEDLADHQANFGAMLTAYSAADNPLAALNVVHQARWEWMSEHDGWFTFGDDEVVGYAAKLMLLERWYRLSHSEAGRRQVAAEQT